jgi:hypothetical protein
MAIKSDKFENHCIEMAKIAVKVGAVMDLKNDALQACFATILISGDKHGVFLEPTPRDTKTPVIQPEPAAAESSATTKGVDKAAAADTKAAEKADAQIKDVPKVTTAEQAEGGKRSALLEGVQNVVRLLNKEGYTPLITPRSLNEIIATDMKITGGLGMLGVDDLEFLIKKLTTTLDTFKHNQRALENDSPF